MFACNGILFNHESPIRGETFVTRKITRAVSRIALGLQEKFYLGNLEAKRDWGHAKDYVRMMWMILQAEQPEDWVIATGKTTAVREFVRMSFAEVGIQLDFVGEGIEEKAYVKSCSNPEYQLELGKEVLAVDPTYFRPTEVDLLIGDPTKAKTKLGWECKYDLQALIKDMMQSDIHLMKKEQYLKDVQNIEYVTSKYEVLNNADALVLLTEWKEFRSPDFEEMKLQLKNPVIFDGRNQYNAFNLEEKGFEYVQIGK
mgnify:CR=1 FL=1